MKGILESTAAVDNLLDPLRKSKYLTLHCNAKSLPRSLLVLLKCMLDRYV